MPRLLHGRVDVTEETVREAREAVAERVAENPLAFATVKRVEFERRFDFLFPELQEDPDDLLPAARKTRDALRDLGKAMVDDGTDAPAGDSNFSAAYTYFGQFVDHDITLEKSGQPGMKPPVGANLQPLSLEEIKEQVENVRTGVLELDSVYNLPAERDPEPNGPKMKIGKVADLGNLPIPQSRPPGKGDNNDLPREGRSSDAVHDRAALIGDPRNDENTIIAQMHVAFLRAHNRLVDEASPPNKFKKAKRRLRRHYQFIVLHDFLKQIADPLIVDDIIENGNRIYDPDEDEFFMPLEFSVAAFRFGHSMVRAAYDFNVNFNRNGIPATLDFLFTFTALSGQLGEEIGVQQPDSDTLPENWIIEWENFFDPQGGAPLSKARKIDTQLVEPLQHLQNMKGEDEGGLAASLAVRNLLRGYQLRMPTGQAVARALRKKLQGVRDIPVLSAQQIRDAAASDKQREVLQRNLPENTTFLKRTPLWYYILAEAAFLRNGRRLGPVGSTIVAEVLVGLVRRSPDSILAQGSTWKPNLPSPQQGRTLEDLLRFARVLRST
jgi:hypothetical protein